MGVESLNNIWIPALLAVLGFLGKALWDIIISMRNKRIELLEKKLQNFYWPVLIRLEKDNAIWESILSKRNDPQSFQYKMASYIEKNHVLQNHQEILTIIEQNIHLAEPDQALTASIRKFIKNVSIYKAIRESGEEKVFPMELGAEWPADFYSLIKKRTTFFQNKLNKKLGA